MDEEKLRQTRLLREPTERRSEAALGTVQQEILGEMAASLGRAHEKAQRAFDVFVQSAQASDGSERALMQRESARQRAAEAVWELQVQREAVGIRDNSDLQVRFPVPPR